MHPHRKRRHDKRLRRRRVVVMPLRAGRRQQDAPRRQQPRCPWIARLWPLHVVVCADYWNAVDQHRLLETHALRCNPKRLMQESTAAEC